nr:hypothetical protein B0A51_14127 [Rachicladosporium sp. CCFEE 5018]
MSITPVFRPSVKLKAMFFDSKYKPEWKHFGADGHDEAKALAGWLLSESAIGGLHRAGMHLLLAHGPDDKVYHATQALNMARDLYAGRESTRSEAQKAARDAPVRCAEDVLQVALEYERELNEQVA